MAEIFVRLNLEDPQDAERAVRGLQQALEDLGVEAKVLEGSTVQLAEAEEGFGEKVGDVSIKVAEAIILHEAWHRAKLPLIRAARSLGIALANTSATVAALNARIGAAQTATVGFVRGGLALLRGGLLGLIGLLEVKAIVGFAKFLDRMGAAGAASAVTKQAFDNLSDSIGEVGDDLQQKLRVATLGTVDDFNLLKTGAFALQTEILPTGERLAELARLATLAGLAVGVDAADGFDIATTAIARHQPILLKQLGVVVSADEAYAKFAARVGKSADELTTHEQTAAFAAEAMDKLRRAVERANLETNNLAVINQQAVAARQNLVQAIQREIAESENLIRTKRTLLGIDIEVRTGLERLTPALETATDAFFGFFLNLEKFPRRRIIGTIAEELGQLTVELAANREEVLRWTETIGGAPFGPQPGLQQARAFIESIRPPPPTSLEAFSAEQIAEKFARDLRIEIARTAEQFAPPPALIQGIEDLTIESVDLTEKFQGMTGEVDRLTEVITASAGDLAEMRRQVFEEVLRPGVRPAGLDQSQAERREIEQRAEELRRRERRDEAFVASVALREQVEQGFITEADMRRIQDRLDELRASVKVSTDNMAEVWAGALEGVVAATIEGGTALQVAWAGVISALVRQIQSIQGVSPLGGGLLGGVIGGVGGLIASTLFDRDRNRGPVQVEVVNRIRLDRDEQQQVTIIQLTDVGGRLLEEFEVKTRRAESRGGRTRLPRPLGI